MKKCFALLVLPLLAGCLTSSVPTSKEWTVECLTPAVTKTEAKLGIARLTQTSVRAPYDERRITICRADGSLAFDAYNQFAAIPSQLLRGPIEDALTASGRFKSVISASSAVSSELSLEVAITRWVLNCAEDGRRSAEVNLSIQLLDKSRALLRSVKGVGVADGAEGNFTAAFSQAFSAAMAEAVRQF